MIYKVVPCNFLLEKEKEANLGEEFTLRNCETVMIRGTDVSLKITGFDPPCIKNIPCISGERVYYELEVGDTKYKNFEETPYDVITKKSDYETYAVFVIDKSESTCNKAIQYSRGADYCWSDLAERSGDQSYCNKISDLSIKDACIEKLVEKFNKNELCNEVASPKQYCKYVTLVEQNKLAECHTIMAFPWNARCYKDIAEKSGEGIQVCETLTPEKAGFCRRAITEIDF